MAEVDAIILAAGLSRRMGARNKLLIEIEGGPMVRRVVETYRAAIDGPVTVVTGHEAARIVQALDGLAVGFVHNPDFAQGQQRSVAVGLGVPSSATATLIGLADQPALTSHDLRALIAAHERGDPSRITIPHHGTQRGNPIVVPAALRARLLENPDRPGCMRFTRDHPELVQRPQLPAEGFYLDVDTPDALAAFQKTHERRAS